MKTKKFGKKLVLNKKTVAHLDTGKLRAAKGGNAQTQVGNTCVQCPITNLDQTCTCKTCFTDCPATGDPCEYCPVFNPG